MQFGFSQYNEDWEKAKVFLKDGTILKGEARLSMPSSKTVSGSNESLRFTEGRKKPIQTFKAKVIDSIIFKLDYRTKVNGKKVDQKRSAKYITFYKNKNKSKLGFAELLIDGELRLLTRSVSHSNNSGGMNNGFTISMFEQQLIQFRNEVPLEIYNTVKMESFKKRAMEYFQDCPSLVSKIEAKTFKSDDLAVILKYYNDNCAK